MGWKSAHIFPFVLKDMQLKFRKCQDIPLTGAKSCQDAAPCIYFNKLKPELFFPGVSFGFSLHLENCLTLSAETSVSRGFTAVNSVKYDVLWNILEVNKVTFSFFSFASLSPWSFSSSLLLWSTSPKVTRVLFQEFKQDVIFQLFFFSKRKGTTMQEKHIKNQTISLIMHLELISAHWMLLLHEKNLKMATMLTKTSSNPAVPVVTHHLPLCAAAAAAGWKYHKALRSLGQTLNSSSGEGLAFICRWVELHELREEKHWICACMWKTERGKQKSVSQDLRARETTTGTARLQR